jgi:Zn-dependent membrane protease YugP
MFIGFSPIFFIISLPAMLFALWAQYRVKSAFSKYSNVRNMHNMNGMETARVLMRNEGLDHVGVNQVQGEMTDFYNPADKTINISQGSVKPSVAAMAIVAHELGHAAQDKEGYFWLRARAGIVGIANLGSNLGVMLFFVGTMLMAFANGPLGESVAWAGVVLFAAAVAFTLVTLPVEFNASSRARQMLMRNGLVSTQEMEGVSAVLNAAALTYVAAAAQAVSQLLYFVFLLMGSRRN